MSKETYFSGKRDKGATSVSKETYFSGKRDKGAADVVATRASSVSKETYFSVKRDLLLCQKRPTSLVKETKGLQMSYKRMRLPP